MHGMHHAVTPYLSEAVEPGGTFCQYTQETGIH